MADVQTIKSVFTDIANEIRTHKGEASTVTYKPANMAAAIADLVVANKGAYDEIVANGTYSVAGYESVTVSIPSDAIPGVSMSGQGYLTAVATSRGWSGIHIQGLTGESVDISGNTSEVTWHLSNAVLSLGTTATGALTINNGNTTTLQITADNLVASNIKEGIKILGVTGTLVEVDIDAILNASY